MGLADIARAKQIQKQLDRLQSVQDAEERDRHAYKFATYQGKDPVDGTDIVEVDGVKTSGFKLMSNAPLSIGDRVNLRPNQQGLQRVDAKNVAPVVVDDIIAEEIVNYIYVSTYGGLVLVINTTTNRITKKINVGSLAYAIIYCPSNKKIYASKAQQVDGISVIRQSSNTVINDISFPAVNLNYPVEIIYSPSNNRIYATNVIENSSGGFEGRLKVIDPATDTIIATITVSIFTTGIAGAMVYCPSNEQIYVCTSTGLAVIDPTTNAVINNITINEGNTTTAYSSSNDRIYVGNFNDLGIAVVNPNTNAVVATIADGSSFFHIQYCVLSNKIYASSATTISVIDVSTNTIVDTIALIGVTGSAYSPATKKLYFANASESVSVINPSSNSVTKTIDLSDGLGNDNRSRAILAIN